MNNQPGTFPTELKILDQTFKVLYFDKASEVDPRGADTMYGHFDRWNHEIRIYNKDGFSEAEVWNSLIHESIHAIIDILKINEIRDLHPSDEEHAVHLLATGLNALLHDNNLNFSIQPTKKSIIKTDAVRIGNIVEHERWGTGIVRELIDNNRCNVEFYPREENVGDRCCICISKDLKIMSTGP